MTRRLALALVSAAVASGTLLSPASADDGGTHVTFQIIGGSLSISEPASVVLGEARAGAGVLRARLGDVTVTDDRGARGGYTVHVVGAAFSTGAGASTYTVRAANVSYAAPAVIGGTGTATRVAGVGGPLDQARVAMVATGVVGVNTSVWNPTVTVTLPADAVAGVYTGSVTHSVA